MADDVKHKAPMTEEELSGVSGGFYRQSVEIAQAFYEYAPERYDSVTKFLEPMGTSCEKVLATIGIKAKCTVFGENLYQEATTGRYILHDELLHWIRSGCVEGEKPWLDPEIEF